MAKNEGKIAEKYLKQRGFRRASGFAINTQEMNPENYDEIFFEGYLLKNAIGDYCRDVEYWIYEPSDGEQIFEDIMEAVEYAEESSDVSFEDFKKSEEKEAD